MFSARRSRALFVIIDPFVRKMRGINDHKIRHESVGSLVDTIKNASARGYEIVLVQKPGSADAENDFRHYLADICQGVLLRVITGSTAEALYSAQRGFGLVLGASYYYSPPGGGLDYVPSGASIVGLRQWI